MLALYFLLFIVPSSILLCNLLLYLADTSSLLGLWLCHLIDPLATWLAKLCLPYLGSDILVPIWVELCSCCPFCLGSFLVTLPVPLLALHSLAQKDEGNVPLKSSLALKDGGSLRARNVAFFP